MSDDELDQLLDTITVGNEESSALSDQYNVLPGYGRYELFGCHRSLRDRRGQRFRQLVIRIADEVGLDRGLLAVNCVAEHNLSVYMTSREVESQEVGLDYWDTLQRSVLASGVPGVGRIRSRRTGRSFVNEQGVTAGAIHAFRDGPTALLALAALLKVYDTRIATAAGGALPKVTRFALIRYAYNASPHRATDLAASAASGFEVLPTRGSPGPGNPLRTATIRAVQAIALSEEFFRNDS